MRVIWKFHLSLTDRIELLIPKGATLLSAQMQHGQPQLWALVNPSAEKIKRYFVWVPTGHSTIDAIDQMVYVDTVQLHGGELVFHLFAEPEE